MNFQISPNYALVPKNIIHISLISAAAASGFARPTLTPPSTNVSNACHVPDPNVSSFSSPNTRLRCRRLHSALYKSKLFCMNIFIPFCTRMS